MPNEIHNYLDQEISGFIGVSIMYPSPITEVMRYLPVRVENFLLIFEI